MFDFAKNYTLETVFLQRSERIDDYIRVPWPNRMGEWRIMRSTIGSYKYDAHGKNPELVHIRMLS